MCDRKMGLMKVVQLFIVLQACGGVWSISTYYLDNYCGKTIDTIIPDQVRLKTRSIDTHDYSTECRVTFSSSLSSKLMVYFKSLNIIDSPGCAMANVTIYDGKYNTYSWSSKPSTIATLCGSSTTPDDMYESTDDYLTIGYTSASGAKPDFDIIVTEFHDGYCYSYETKCSNGKCIDDDIACNGFNPCGDESDCNARTIAIIIGSTVGGVVFVIAVVSVVVCLYCMKRKQAGRTGYLANRGPVPMNMTSTNMTSTNMTSANMTTGFGAQYNPPPAYNPAAYGMPGQQQQVQYPATQPYPQPEQQQQQQVQYPAPATPATSYPQPGQQQQ